MKQIRIPSQPWPLPLFFYLFVFFSYIDATLATLPLVDFDRMGSVGLGGAFAGLDVFNSSGSSVTFDSSTSTLLSRSSDGALTRLGSTNSGGSILAGCVLSDTFYFAGSFSSINGTSASNIASYSGTSFSALGSNGPSGQVNALFCDSVNNKIWAGGDFSDAVLVWDAKQNSWSSAPFGGLTGSAAEVLSITTNSSASSLFFAGSFLTSFQGNGSVVNTTNNPNVPFSTGASPFSSSLVPIPLEGAEVEGEPSSSDSSFSDISTILCPAGNDGAGNTWFAADGSSAQITARTFSFLSASGVRLGNTFLDGRGTTGFSVTTIPDNTVRQLTYIDPSTGTNTTCTDPCPLSTDSSVLYQDFLFDSVLDITGVQVTLTEWQGAGPGLHIFQLLSSGAFASAIASQNNASCYAPSASNTSRIGTWTEKDVSTNIAGTTEEVLVASVAVGTSAANSPSFTWMPYVSASGQYNVNMLVPGCTNFQDCALRTSVSVTVFPGGSQNPWVTTVDQTNTDDATTLIYSGPVVPTSDEFVMTVEMTLADNPTGSGQDGEYEIVADRIQLILTEASNSTSSSGSGNSTSTSSTNTAFGFFEWPISSSSTVNASSTLSNSTETALDTIGFDLFTDLGGSSSLSSSSTKTAIAAVAHHSSGTVFLGGTFSTSSSSNIIMFKNGALTALSQGGLNGPVTSLALDGDTLFVGGSFSDTASSSNSGLRGVAIYDVSQDQWTALEGGVDGAVGSLDFIPTSNQLQVAGNFTTLLSSTSSNTTGTSSAGLALWNVSSSAWVNSGGFLVGGMTFVGNGASTGSTFLAGNVASELQFGASGMVLLQNGNSGEDDGAPVVTPLGVTLDNTVSSSSSSSTSSKKKRTVLHAHARTSSSSSSLAARTWIPNIKIPRLFARQTSPSTLPSLPADPIATAPAVLAGAFWTNTTSGHETAIIGGNFSFTNGSTTSQAVAFYDLSTSSLSPLTGDGSLNGTVRSLLVEDDTLYIGGSFNMVDSSSSNTVNGFAIYDLINRQWDISSLQALSSSTSSTSGSNVVVRSITVSTSETSTIIVAGTFAQAGSLTCKGICSWDASAKQWNALGDGITGEVAAVAYSGSNLDTLVASGSISLDGGATASNVAQFTFSNSSWSAIGDSSSLAGPVTAVEVNNGNGSSIFAAGRSSDGTSSFLSFWDGLTWSSLDSNFDDATNVTQLTMVPLQDTHSANSIIEQDRMLLVTGNLQDSSFGNASAVLFDGQSFIPYIVSSSTTGTPGVVSQLFRSLSTFSFTQQHFLATGIVILISIAISAGVIFLLVLIGILWTLFSRRDDALNNKYDAAAEGEEDDDSARHRPSSLLAHINAATRTTILGTQSPYNQFNYEKEAVAAAAAGGAGAAMAAHGHDRDMEYEGEGPATSAGADQDLFGPDGSNYLRAETPSDAIVGGMVDEDDQVGRIGHVRYSFDEDGDGELALREGQELEILDDRDHSWWYARDPRTGAEGVVPAAYLY